jgi:hypothetical protein
MRCTSGVGIAICSGSSRCSANAWSAPAAAVSHRPIATSAGSSAWARRERARASVDSGAASSTRRISSGRPEYVSSMASLSASSSPAGCARSCSRIARLWARASSGNDRPHMRFRVCSSTIGTSKGSSSAADASAPSSTRSASSKRPSSCAPHRAGARTSGSDAPSAAAPRADAPKSCP